MTDEIILPTLTACKRTKITIQCYYDLMEVMEAREQQNDIFSAEITSRIVYLVEIFCKNKGGLKKFF